MSRFPTLHAIAAECGVSHSTVWRALRDDPRVHPTTSRRIRQVAEEVGYRTDARVSPPGAQEAASTGRRPSIIIPYNKESLTKDSDRIFWDFVEGATQAADPAKFGVQMVGYDNSEHELSHIRALVEDERAAGVMDFNLNPATIDYLVAQRVPFSSYLADIRNLDPRRPARAYSDPIQGYVSALQYLTGLNHRLIGFITTQNPTSRCLAKECKAAGQLVAEVPEFLPSVALENFSSPQAIWKALIEHWGKPANGRWPHTIMCSHDMIAHRTIAALRAHGMDVPTDVSIIGFGDSQVARLTDPPLTTLHNPRKEIGAAMLYILESLIADPNRNRNMVQMIPMTLVQRQSVQARS